VETISAFGEIDSGHSHFDRAYETLARESTLQNKPGAVRTSCWLPHPSGVSAMFSPAEPAALRVDPSNDSRIAADKALLYRPFNEKPLTLKDWIRAAATTAPFYTFRPEIQIQIETHVLKRLNAINSNQWLSLFILPLSEFKRASQTHFVHIIQHL